MINPGCISDKDIEAAVSNIRERAETFTQASQLFVDTNIVNILTKEKNQIVYGRKGTGKTHLFNRIWEFYRSAYAEQKLLPIYVDGRAFAEIPIGDNPEPGILILIAYRRFLDSIISSIEDFVNDTISLSILQRIWPTGARKERIEKISDAIAEIREQIQFGQMEIGGGIVSTERADKTTHVKNSQLKIDLMLRSKIIGLSEGNAELKAGLSNVSSRRADESLKIIYQGLTVINFANISELLDIIIAELEAKGIIILLDEWSAIELDHQPLLAEMIRSTIVAGRRVSIKFACLPFLTRLNTTKENGQSIGFTSAEEIFVDVDLDQFYNSFVDMESTTAFLLRVLQKHLGDTVDILANATVDDAIRYFHGTLFEDAKAIEELVHASAGVPRDFLRIFTKAFRYSHCKLPITKDSVRRGIHEFFQNEKLNAINQVGSESFAIYRDIFKKVCLPVRTYLFFVSQAHSKNRILQELLHRRLVHLISEGNFAFAGNEPGMYDVYAMDYGYYIMMSSGAKGEELLNIMKKQSRTLTAVLAIGSRLSAVWRAQLEEEFKKKFSEVLVTTIDVDHPDIKTIFDDCSKLVVDDVIIYSKV